MHTRKNVWQLGGHWAAPILWYARGVKAMKTKKLAEPTSWRFYGAIHGLFPIMVLVMGAVRDVDRTLVTVARSLGATTLQLYWKVLLPAIVPSVLAGMRLGIAFCLLGVLVVEMFAGVRGMGHVMGSLANGFQAPELFAATGLVSAASIAIVLALDHLNDKLSHWRG